MSRDERVDLFLWRKEITRDPEFGSVVAELLEEMKQFDPGQLTASRAFGVLLERDRAGGFLNDWERQFCDDLAGTDETTWTQKQRHAALRLLKTHRVHLGEAPLSRQLEGALKKVRPWRRVP